MARSHPKPEVNDRRSICPVACALDLFGDRWTLLIVRDLICGRSRFKELAGSPEGIATNLLTDRLGRLLRQGVVERVTPADGSEHLAYRLTAKGESLRPLVEAIRDWGLQWEPGTQARLRADLPDVDETSPAAPSTNPRRARVGQGVTAAKQPRSLPAKRKPV